MSLGPRLQTTFRASVPSAWLIGTRRELARFAPHCARRPANGRKAGEGEPMLRPKRTKDVLPGPLDPVEGGRRRDRDDLGQGRVGTRGRQPARRRGRYRSSAREGRSEVRDHALELVVLHSGAARSPSRAASRWNRATAPSESPTTASRPGALGGSRSGGDPRGASRRRTGAAAPDPESPASPAAPASPRSAASGCTPRAARTGSGPAARSSPIAPCPLPSSPRPAGKAFWPWLLSNKDTGPGRTDARPSIS